jgi:hypothetical protein
MGLKLILAAAVLAGVAGCSEKAQRTYSEDGQGAYNLETGSALAERTRHQGESERIGN